MERIMSPELISSSLEIGAQAARLSAVPYRLQMLEVLFLKASQCSMFGGEVCPSTVTRIGRGAVQAWGV